MDKKPSETAEALARQLQEKLQRQRPRWLRWVPLLAVVLFGALLILAWVLYPTQEPPRLTVTALDAILAPGEATTVRACLDPTDADVKVGSLAGLETFFWIEKAAPVLDDSPRRKSAADELGQASYRFEPGEEAQSAFHVRFLGQLKKYEAKDRAVVYHLPKDAPLLLVEVEETLADLDPKLWSKTNPLSIPVRAGAAKALTEVNAKQHFHIVYLALDSTPAKEYRRVRIWIDLKSKEGLPAGPVLGRLHFGAESLAVARHALLSDMRDRFTGPCAAVVRTAETAEQCQALKIRAIAMGGGDFPAAIARIKGWDELPAILGK